MGLGVEDIGGEIEETVGEKGITTDSVTGEPCRRGITLMLVIQ